MEATNHYAPASTKPLLKDKQPYCTQNDDDVLLILSYVQAEQERSRQVVESLEREGRQAREAALALAARHEEQLREEHAHRMTLHERVQAAELLAAEAERRRVEDVQALEAQVHAANKGAAAAQRQLEEERSAWQRKLLEERTAMQCQLEEERSAWRRQWDTDRAVLVECHEAETLELIRVWEERVKEAESVTAAQAARHAEEVGDVRGQWAAELKAAQQLHKEEIETIRVDAAEQVATAHAACAALTAEFEASKCQAEAMCSAAAARLRRVEDEWEQRLAEVTASLGVREAEASELRGAVRRRELKLAQARGAAKQLEDKLAEAEGVIGKMHKNIAHMNKRLQECESSVLDAEDRIAQLAASRFALAAFLLEQRRLDRAARVIQRAFRAHRLRVVQRQRVEGYAALHEAQSALGTLAAQHAELEERRHANLAFAGQTLVAESLGVLQDAVEGLMATFLLPAKDLKAVQRFRNKRAVGAAVTGPGPLVPPLGSAAEEWFEDKQVQIMSNSRCEGGELIRAFTP